MQVRRPVVEQLLHEPVRARVGDVLVVVEDQVQLLVDRRRTFDDGCHHAVDRLAAGTFQRDLVFQRHAQALQRGQQVDEERAQMLVFGAQRQPGNLRAVLHHRLAPLHQQGGLAETGTADDQPDAAMLHALQLVEQPLAGNGLRTDSRRRELGGYEKLVGKHCRAVLQMYDSPGGEVPDSITGPCHCTL
ncbi:hypothetical protein D3C78_653750 [compost metagenome]